MLWVPGRKIILTGNERAKFPKAAKDYLAAHFNKISEEDIELETNSPYTIDSAITLRERATRR
jgi:hypothetical protein